LKTQTGPQQLSGHFLQFITAVLKEIQIPGVGKYRGWLLLGK
jgi:hypothetical protein